MEEKYTGKNGHCLCGFRLVNAGMWYFIIGIILGFGVLIHYLVGSHYDNTDRFLSNITLWFGSPLSLSSAYLQLGGLGMAIAGIACHIVHCHTTNEETNTCMKKKGCSLALCHIGMIALLITGYIGYFIIDMIWPGFYYTPISAGKNLWLILQGLSILIYVIGLICTCCCLCKCCKSCHERPNNNVRP
jgi:hypothetical protein